MINIHLKLTLFLSLIIVVKFASADVLRTRVCGNVVSDDLAASFEIRLRSYGFQSDDQASGFQEYPEYYEPSDISSWYNDHVDLNKKMTISGSDKIYCIELKSETVTHDFSILEHSLEAANASGEYYDHIGIESDCWQDDYANFSHVWECQVPTDEVNKVDLLKFEKSDPRLFKEDGVTLNNDDPSCNQPGGRGLCVSGVVQDFKVYSSVGIVNYELIESGTIPDEAAYVKYFPKGMYYLIGGVGTTTYPKRDLVLNFRYDIFIEDGELRFERVEVNSEFDNYNTMVVKNYFDGNFIYNGSFENKSEVNTNLRSFKYRYSGWSIYEEVTPIHDFSFVKPVSGKDYMKIQVVGDGNTSEVTHGRLDQKIFLKSNSKYKLEYYYSTVVNNFTGSIEPEFHSIAVGSGDRYDFPEPNYNLNVPWTKQSIEFETGDEASVFKAWFLDAPVEWGEVAVFIDDVTLHEVNDNVNIPSNSTTISLSVLNNNNRPMKTTTKYGNKNISALIKYDKLGRTQGNSMVFPETYTPSSDVSSCENVIGKTKQEIMLCQYYTDQYGVLFDGNGFDSTVYSNDPLGRVETSYRAGVSDQKDSVFYTSEGEYFKKIITDKNNNESYEITDLFGNVIEKRNQWFMSDISTTYEYDGNGNLIKSVSPKGPNGEAQTTLMNYNSLGQLLSERHPDIGILGSKVDDDDDGDGIINGEDYNDRDSTVSIYDKSGRVRFTRTPGQRRYNKFNYTKYDDLGHIIEIGEGRLKPDDVDMPDAELHDHDLIKDMTFPSETSTMLSRFENFSVDTLTLNTYDECPLISDFCSDNTNYIVIVPGGAGVEFKDLNAAYDALKAWAIDQNFEITTLFIYQLYEAGSTQVDPEDQSRFLAFKNKNNEHIKKLGIKSIEKESEAHKQLLRENNMLGDFSPLYQFNRLTQTTTFNPDLDKSGVTNMLVTSFIYDKYGNVIEQYQSNDYVNRNDEFIQKMTFEYSPTGILLNSSWYKNNGEDILHAENYFYDEFGRMSAIKDMTGDVITEYFYDDDLQRLSGVKLGSKKNMMKRMHIEYTYHIQGAVDSANVQIYPGRTIFAEKLFFEDAPYTGVTPRTDGSLAAYYYELSNGITSNLVSHKREMVYTYDKLDRLVKAEQNGAHASEMNSYYNYYDNGAIRGIRRGSETMTGQQQASLSNYDYFTGTNRLKSLTSSPLAVKAGDTQFEDMNREYTAMDMLYDRNGNLKKDHSKNYYTFYNSYNLPYKFSHDNGHSLEMAYSGTTRIGKFDYTNDKPVKFTHYLMGGKELREDFSSVTKENSAPQISQILPLNGGLGRKVFYTDGTSEYEFYVKNYLGSTVLTYNNDKGKVNYLTEYYPFGMQVNEEVDADAENVTPKFTGKEKDDGIELSYFGARYYDADIGLWTSVDPARQFHSGYTYSFNNPVNTLDPDGKNGELLGQMFANAFGQSSISSANLAVQAGNREFQARTGDATRGTYQITFGTWGVVNTAVDIVNPIAPSDDIYTIMNLDANLIKIQNGFDNLSEAITGDRVKGEIPDMKTKLFNGLFKENAGKIKKTFDFVEASGDALFDLNPIGALDMMLDEATSGSK